MQKCSVHRCQNRDQVCTANRSAHGRKHRLNRKWELVWEGERLIGMQSFQLGHMKQLGITRSKIQGENHSISTSIVSIIHHKMLVDWESGAYL